MEVLTIEHSAFQQLISKIDAMDKFIRKAKLEQQSSLDDDWVVGRSSSCASYSPYTTQIRLYLRQNGVVIAPGSACIKLDLML